MSRLTNFYNSYHKLNKNNFYNKLISRNNFTYFYILEFLHEAYEGRKFGKVLDIGCGVGTLALYMAKYSKFVLGLDVSDSAVEIAERAKTANSIKNIKFVASELIEGLGSFDTIICTEVIEHIHDQDGFLKKINSSLVNGGLLLITTPSKDNLLTRVGYFAKFDNAVGHLRRYTEPELKSLLVKHGFKVKAIRSVEGLPRMLLFTTKFGFLIKGIRGPLIKVFHIIDRLSTYIFGAHDIQVIAIKSNQ